ncbi:MAG: signal peptidase II [Peptoniphilaceae bacterium]|nr:signal peptidase II [Peptoniphilaceae bacterium]MDY5765718.1 signal peptidase II [Peptoniphilaceae bacterium]
MLGIILTVILGLGADQISKWAAAKYLAGGNDISVIGNFLKLHYLENRGAAFGILQGKMIFFVLITIFAVGLLIYLLRKEKNASIWFQIGIALILFGALGNFIDRIRLGYVIDFIKLDLVSFYEFPIFNVADIGVTIGTAIVILYELFIPGKERSRK